MLAPLLSPPLQKGCSVLIACEESGRLTTALRKRDINACSVDLVPTRGNAGWHYQADTIEMLYAQNWDCCIAFPPCTHLSSSGAKHFGKKRRDGRQEQGIRFFMEFVHWQEHNPARKLCIKNPVGIMSTIYRKPDQIIQPYHFGEDASKATCLWLFNLPLLQHTQYATPSYTHNGLPRWSNQAPSGADGRSPSPTRSMNRSTTYNGIAEAMSAQWAY